ncbi:MAG: heavy metal-associated domain-containing protein [Peptococcaceae bacterium]|jgi:copper chaperone CopZ|nr:heavy metal-associated domain-containing protein [Peptococcaceae bacterium]
MIRITLPVEGMTGNLCRTVVEQALMKVPGVSRAEVDLTAGKALVGYDPALVTRVRLVRAVEDAGYGVPSGGIAACFARGTAAG